MATSGGNGGKSVYGTGPGGQPLATHTLAVLVDNEPGVLARVTGLFSGRGYNIDSLAVAETDAGQHLSRITLVCTGTPAVIEQIKAQLERLVPVRRVADLTMEGPFVERELALVKIAATGEHRIEALRVADIFRARVVDSTLASFVFEVTGSADKVMAFLDLMRPLGMVEISRTGRAALARGTVCFCEDRTT
ncbi:MAG TPA: acetolactate synthase small subunit [Rhodospirillaceae bacterium]|jgi:acetolactate synthase-1/3 small subunit|nr:acetolactate synthase small subunit [Alphaproteobacteria bacterium]HBH26472.1 acetolactate synthase small subunit [Rhodospirillaceae bacterium]